VKFDQVINPLNITPIRKINICINMGPNKPYQKNCGINIVGIYRKSLGFFGIIFQRPTLDKLRYLYNHFVLLKIIFTVNKASVNLNQSWRQIKDRLSR
jgi:hypothetical protein